MLTPRQELLLAKVIDCYAATGQPVGSKALAGDPGVSAGPSTIRNELAVLEELGLLAHPHTSAGRVPTEAGYRYYVDRLVPRRTPRQDLSTRPLGLSLVRREVDEAMRMTTETLSQVARAVGAAGDGPAALTRLEVQFRGMGFPEQEITVTATVTEESDGVAQIETEAELRVG